MKTVGIAGIGMVAPGVESWESGSRLLVSPRDSGEGYDITAEFPLLKPSALSANERRRTTETIKLALQCAQDAMSGQTAAQASDPDLTSVFACSSGDLNVVDKILTALAQPGKPVSPTHFHNSVHNAPAGYWSIATGSRAASTSLAAGNETFSVGLLEAISQVIVDKHPVLLVAYDFMPPPMLRSHSPVKSSIGVAMLLVPEKSRYTLSAEIRNSDFILTTMQESGLEKLRHANPAAKCLPLLQCIAKQQSRVVCLPYLHGQGLELSVVCND